MLDGLWSKLNRVWENFLLVLRLDMEEVEQGMGETWWIETLRDRDAREAMFLGSGSFPLLFQ